LFLKIKKNLGEKVIAHFFHTSFSSKSAYSADSFACTSLLFCC